MSSGKQLFVSSAYSSHNRVQLIRGGSEYFSLLLELIDKAQQSIHLQTYIFEEDETGKQVATALIKAAQKEGVPVARWICIPGSQQRIYSPVKEQRCFFSLV